ncbi:UNVERIFIED_CONTAM: hypothetical protein FKN15_025583 [Acipenser sinensis]
MVKMRTKGYFIAAGKRKAKERRAKYKHLNAALQRLSLLQLRWFPVSDEIAQTKLDLSVLCREEQRKVMHNAKVQKMEEDEKCTRFLFQKTREKRHLMSSMLDSSGRIVEDSEGVKKVVENFYRDLYNIKATDDTLIEWFLSQLEPDSVWDEEEEKDPELTLEELQEGTTKKVVDRIIHRFIWGSKMERVKRATMSKADKKGGKGVPDVVQLTRVQGLTQTIKNIQALDRKVCYMNRFYFATCLRALGLYTIDNTVPYSWDPPLYNRTLRVTIYKLGLDKAKLASWEYKAVTKYLAGSQEIEKVATFSLTQSQKIWENVSHRCPYAKCRKRETPAHIFWECDVAGSVWLSVSVFLNRFADTAKMTTETVLYGPAGGIATSTAKCVWRVINVVKQILWEGRNVCVYHKQELDTITTTRRAQTLIKDFVTLDIRTLGKDKACADWRIAGLQDVKME